MPAAGLLDDAGALPHLQSISLNPIRAGYGRWLAWLLANAPKALAEYPARRGTPERLRAWMQSLEAVTPMSRSLFLDGALGVMTSAAPAEDWTAPKRLRAWQRQVAMRDYGSRKQGRILSSAVLPQGGLDLALCG
jgi:hypothetical protein